MAFYEFSSSALEVFESVDPSQPLLAPHAAGELEVEVEVVQRVALVGGAAAWQRQAGDLAAQPEPPLQVQGAIGPVFLAAPGEAGVVDGHVGEAGEGNEQQFLIKKREKKNVIRLVTAAVTWCVQQFMTQVITRY